MEFKECWDKVEVIHSKLFINDSIVSRHAAMLKISRLYLKSILEITGHATQNKLPSRIELSHTRVGDV